MSVNSTMTEMKMVIPDGSEEDLEGPLVSIVIALGLIGVLALGYCIHTKRIRHLPESTAAILFGFLMGLVVNFGGLSGNKLYHFDADLFFYVLLPPIIFEAGFALEKELYFFKLNPTS